MNTVKFWFQKVVLLLVVAFGIVACSGGGGSTPTPPPTTTYTISGTVTGAPSVAITLSGASIATTTKTTAADGSYSFTGLANGSYTVTPSLATYAFSPTSLAVNVSGANVTGKNFTATAAATTYSISGVVSGAGGVTITLSGDNTGSVVTGAGGAYIISGLVPGSYTVTPSLSGYTFNPTSSPVTIAAANSTANNFTATAIPVAHTLSGTVSPTLAGVTISVTGTANATATTNASGAYTVTGLFDGPYTVTPTKTGYTFAPNSTGVTMAGINVTGTNFTGTANSAVQATISGAVTGPWVEGVTITMSGGATGTTTTNASGNYSFTVASGQSYTFTPSLAGYTYLPAAATVVIPAGSSTAVTATNLVASSATASNSLSGTVSYAGVKTGLVYVRVSNTGCAGCNNTVAATSIALTGVTGSRSGTYTVRGLQSGTYSVTAEMDALVPATGQPNASNPAGSSATATITTANLTGVNITIADPATVTPVVPTLDGVSPGSGSAFVLYQPPTNVSNQEIATSYKIYWGTDIAASTGGGSATFTAQGLNGSFYVLKGLTNGSVLYFKISALVGATESAASAVVGPKTIGATTGANTVSGTVSFPGTATGPMMVGLYSGTTGVYFTNITSPGNPQNYSIAGVPAGSYFPFAIIDNNNNGIVDSGDISNTNGQGSTITVSANTTSNLTLAAVSETAFVYTNHQFDGVTSNYNLNLGTNDGTKRAVAVTLFSGPNATVPWDIGATNGNWSGIGLGPTAPVVGDTYGFKVTFSDGTTQNISGSVTGVLSTSNMPTSLTVNTTTSRTIPTFTWAAPASPPAGVYTYRLNLNGSGANWDYPQDNGLPSTTLSAVYNADGNANPASLVTGTAYTWQVQVQDANNNSATFQAPTYTP